MTLSRRSKQDGFTLIEVMVAALILVIGMTALASVLIGASNQAAAAVTESQLTNLADQQMELVRVDVADSGFPELAMSAMPTAATLPSGTAALRQSTYTDPDGWVAQGTVGAASNAACFQIQANYDSGTTAAPPVGFNPWSNCQSSGAEPLAVVTQSTSGALVQVSTQGSGTWTAGSWPPPACPAAPAVASPCTQTLGTGRSAVIYTFVTYTYSGCSVANPSQAGCPSVSTSTGTVTGCTSAASFPTSPLASTVCGDSRRVTVVVLPVGTHAVSRQTPLYLSSVFTNPSPSPGEAAGIGVNVVSCPITC